MVTFNILPYTTVLSWFPVASINLISPGIELTSSTWKDTLDELELLTNLHRNTLPLSDWLRPLSGIVYKMYVTHTGSYTLKLMRCFSVKYFGVYLKSDDFVMLYFWLFIFVVDIQSYHLCFHLQLMRNFILRKFSKKTMV